MTVNWPVRQITGQDHKERNRDLTPLPNRRGDQPHYNRRKRICSHDLPEWQAEGQTANPGHLQNTTNCAGRTCPKWTGTAWTHNPEDGCRSVRPHRSRCPPTRRYSLHHCKIAYYSYMGREWGNSL